MRKRIILSNALLLLTFHLIAQNPGGVSSGLKLWIRSNAGTSTTTNGAAVDSWTYTNDGTKSFSSTGGERPLFSSSAVNFLPGIRFNGGQLMDGPTGVNAPLSAGDDDYAIFGVWLSRSGTPLTPQRVWSQRNTGASSDGASLWLYNSQYGDQPEIAPFTQAATKSYTASTWYISQLNLLNQAINDLEIIDQTNLSTSPLVLTTDPGNNGNGVRSLSDVLNRLGSRNTPPASEEPLIGDVAEIIVFDRTVSAADRNQIFSYLALKYGVTIMTNLLSSTASVVWDATANSTYNNSVFGLGRDDNSGLLNSQSNSIETGSGDGTGQSAKGNIVLSSPSSLDDLDFLIIGNDNAALTESTLDLPVAASGSQRLIREWKVQHTGNAGTVSFSFDFTGLTTTGTIGNVGDFRLAVDADGNGNFANGTIRYYTPSSFSGNVAQFTGVTFNNNEVFMIITSPNPIILPVNWKDFSATLVNNAARLRWTVENNADGLNYEVEHSVNGVNFETVGIVDNDVSLKQYTFTHPVLSRGKHYYRIRQVDINGAYIYSKIVSIDAKGTDFVVLVPNNPVRNDVATISINSRINAPVFIELWSLDGKKISTTNTRVNTGTNMVSIKMDNLAKGQYIFRVNLGSYVETIKISKL